jgi:hypothetical protein
MYSRVTWQHVSGNQQNWPAKEIVLKERVKH